MRYVTVILACAIAIGLSACASRGQTVGTVGGAVAGGAIGSAATGGSTAGTLGGAALGGVVGNEAGKRYEEHQK